MRALHDKIGDAAWTEEQRTQWQAAKSELRLDAQFPAKKSCAATIKRMLKNRSRSRVRHRNPEQQADERRAPHLIHLRRGLGE
jgi:hypothetical protein